MVKLITAFILLTNFFIQLCALTNNFHPFLDSTKNMVFSFNTFSYRLYDVEANDYSVWVGGVQRFKYLIIVRTSSAHVRFSV